MRKVPYPTPGEILLEEFLKPMGITPYRLAKEIGVLYEIEAKIPEEETVNTWIKTIQEYGYEKVIQG